MQWRPCASAKHNGKATRAYKRDEATQVFERDGNAAQDQTHDDNVSRVPRCDKHCNCNVTSKLKDGRCMYDEQCRMSMIVYALECKLCTGHVYIGKTQRYLKIRTAEHFYDI